MSGRKAPPMSSAYKSNGTPQSRGPGSGNAGLVRQQSNGSSHRAPLVRSPSQRTRNEGGNYAPGQYSPSAQSPAYAPVAPSQQQYVQQPRSQAPQYSPTSPNAAGYSNGKPQYAPPSNQKPKYAPQYQQPNGVQRQLPVPPNGRPNGQPKPSQMRTPTWDDDISESDNGTFAEDGPEGKAGPAGPNNPNIPARSYALLEDQGVRTNLGNTSFVMALLSEMWLFNLVFLCGGVYYLTFMAPGFYDDNIDSELWNMSCYWKLAWILPLPYTLICFWGLVMPFRTPKFLYDESLPKRRVDNLYILTVTKGDNREAVYRSWNAHKHLERLHPCVRVHVLTDEPYFFENINCYTCPKAFQTKGSKYKARALEWYRQTMRYTEHDWVLHLDEESVVDDETVKRILEFIWYEHDYHWGQGVILYNQYNYWKNWLYTVADAIRVGDDLARFQLQYSYFHKPIFGAHGSFLLSNGAVENDVTWDLGSLTEDYEFAMQAWYLGYKCGKVPGLIREQSPMDLIGFLKQRRRWYVGIKTLPHFLPKFWAFFWTVGTFALYGTVIGIPLGIFFPSRTPRWFNLCKNFSFVNFVYLYLVGVFIQEVDKKTNPILLIIRLIATFIIQFAASVLEAMAVTYGLVSPPTGFDVIKK